FRFRRAHWLVAGKSTAQVLEEEILLTNAALRHRLGLERVRGFRASEEYPDGLKRLPEAEALLKRLGFDWVSTHYPPVAVPPRRRPTPELMAAIVEAQGRAQPYLYASGLVEIPKAPVSDVAAFRTGPWALSDFLESVRRGVEWAIEHRAVYNFAGHSSVLVVKDPEFQVLALMDDLVKQAGDRAEWVIQDQIAERTRARA